MGKLSELRRDAVSDLLNLSGLLHQQCNGTGEGSKELIPVRRPSQCARRGISHFLRKKIEATAVVSRKAAPAAREAERVVSHAAHPVLCLPESTAFDAEPGPHSMMHGVAKQLQRLRGLHMHRLSSFPEQEPELRAERAKLGRWCDRQVKLQAARQQEDPVDGRAAWQVEELSCGERRTEIESEVLENFTD